MTRLHLAGLCFPILVTAACEPPSEYEAMLMREAARTDTVRTLFFNYELGMSRQAFYDSSWALNRRELVTHGPSNMNVQYKLTDQLPHVATMLYYPDFKEDRVVQMRVRISYDAWAPWNRQLWSDSLIFDVRDLMEVWYGEGFLHQQVSLPLIGPTLQFVKIDANRQITIQRGSDSEVLVNITDLHAIPVQENE